MIKILHTADIHLDSPLKSLALRDEALRDLVSAATRDAFARIVDVALTEEVAALLIAGDLFDGKERSARTGAFLLSQLDRLRARNIQVYYIKGNHDAENPVTGALDLPDNVHTFSARGGTLALTDDIYIHGVSFADKHAPDSLLPRFDPPVPGAVNIAMLHTSLNGAPGHDPYAPCSLADLTALNFDYWALGHIHRRQVHATAPWVVMPGIPQGRDIGEVGPKSATLLSIENGQITIDEVMTAGIEFTAQALDISTTTDTDSLRALIRDFLYTQAQALTARSGVIRLTLTGTTPHHWHILRDLDLWQAQTAELARATGTLWLDKLRLDIQAPDTASPTSDATGELAMSMQALQAEDGFTSTARATIDTLLAELPPAVRSALAPDEASLATLYTDLADEGRRTLIAQMKGASA